LLEFRILGPVEVSDETGPLPLGGQKQRALLGLLLLHAGQVLSTDRLVDELWGESAPRTATTSLQNFVSQLRKLLGADRLATRPPGYVLQLGSDELDLTRFERLVTEARGLEAAERSRTLREALALWRGPPLADLFFEAFAQGEIRRLEEVRLGALEERVAADLELGGAGELVPELEGLVRAHPQRERLRGQLILALYRSGRQAEALQAYHDARRTLSEELGIDPSPALQQLYGAILRQESGLEAAERVRPVADHYGEVVKALLSGRLVAVLGAGVGLAGDESLAGVTAHLAEAFDCPPEHGRELARVTEYAALMNGVGPLYDELHALFDRDYAPGQVHTLLATVAGLLRERGVPRQLVVTTNFDLALERAFAEADEPLDVVSYVASGRHRGRYLHRSAEGDATVVEVPNAYPGLALEDRTVVLKLHGQVDRRPEREWESFVVSEDDHIDVLGQGELASVVPVTLAAKLRRSHFLFLGYPLRDWGLRTFLFRVWGRERAAYRSWAVQPEPNPIERELWRQRGVDVFDIPLATYVEELGSRLAAER